MGRPPRAPNRAGLLRGEHQGSSPRLSGSPSSGSASLDRGTPPDYFSSPRCVGVLACLLRSAATINDMDCTLLRVAACCSVLQRVEVSGLEMREASRGL